METKGTNMAEKRVHDNVYRVQFFCSELFDVKQHASSGGLLHFF